VAGNDGYKSNIRIIDPSDKVLKSFSPEEGKYTQVSFIKTPKSKVSGFVTGNDKGGLSIFSYPFQD
jgi:WD40 repeat protein